jgi:hypothetical protein
VFFCARYGRPDCWKTQTGIECPFIEKRSGSVTRCILHETRRDYFAAVATTVNAVVSSVGFALAARSSFGQLSLGWPGSS